MYEEFCERLEKTFIDFNSFFALMIVIFVYLTHFDFSIILLLI
jgi:hypothetical protein